MKISTKRLPFFSLLFLVSAVSWAQDENVFVVADFDSSQPTNNIGREMEIWLKDDGSDSTQTCEMSFVKEDALGKESGRSLGLDYDVDSPYPAYNGFRTGLKGFDAAGYKSLNFYVKGDSKKGFPKRLKIELIQTSKPPSPYIVEGITDQWQKITVPLSEFWAVEDWSALDKFVVVFADITTDPKTGAIELDQIHFSR